MIEPIIRQTEIRMIAISKINILNPRVRNQKAFSQIVTNMARVGMKRPITVTYCPGKSEGKDYDLVCGQGRIEAFVACGQTEIPAILIDASEEQALIMSLVENLARRQHRGRDLLQGIEILQKQGYQSQQIAEKTGLAKEYVIGLLNLMKRGEERLLTAVEAGQMPISLAIQIAENPENEQRVLHEAYESKLLRGKRLLLARRLISRRKKQGKAFSGRESRGKRDNGEKLLTVQEVMKVYQKEIDRKRLLTRKADIVANRLLFVMEALKELFADDNFSTLLRAEGLLTLPKPLAGLFDFRKS